MSELVRKQFYITKTQETLLKSRAKEAGLTETELVRQAIDAQVRKISFARTSLQAWREESSFIRGLMAEGPVKGGRNWQREDLYER
jgi:hypothetical protein